MMKCYVVVVLIIIAYGQFAFWLGVYLGDNRGYERGQLDTLPTQSEVQEALGLEPDGVIGPESRRVWNRTIERRTCDEAAMPIMEAFHKNFNDRYFPGMEFP